LTEIDRERVEALLNERAEEIARRRRSVEEDERTVGSDELSHLHQHPADEGTETLEKELDVTEDDLFEEEERRIEEARRALAEGTYGRCVVCGEPIPPERLEAMPEAIRCIRHQREFEASR
jgi:DnaK suppressor protein